MNTALEIRSNKSTGIRLRFRLWDTGGVQLYYKSRLKADATDLAKLDKQGEPKPKVKIYNEELTNNIRVVRNAMEQAYRILDKKGTINSDNFQRTTDALIDGYEDGEQPEKVDTTMLTAYDKFVEAGAVSGVFGRGTLAVYGGLRGILQRFLIINKIDGISYLDFDADMVVKLKDFIENEYQYTDRYRGLYAGMADNNVPTAKRSQNTTATKMKKLRAFFKALEQKALIPHTPFTFIQDGVRKSLTREVYDEPICLTKEELLQVLAYEPKKSLESAKQAFVVQCALGCRIGDFQRLTMENVSVEDGVPLIHYVPEKTSHISKKEVKTPLVRFAFDIIKETGFNFPILRNVFGKSGYNVKIRQLLHDAGIDRQCNVTNNEGKQKSLPLYAVASTKLARKTFVEMCKQVQVDNYAAGLHSRGSRAVERYQTNSIKDRFILQTAAFGETLYKVDKDLNVIDEQAQEEKPTQSQETAFNTMLAAVATMSQEQKAQLLKALAQ